MPAPGRNAFRITLTSLLIALSGLQIAGSAPPAVPRFELPVFYGVGEDPGNVVVADFNGDGRLDLATANYGSGTVSVLLGMKGGAFAAGLDFPVGLNAIRLVEGDFNGDGNVDLIAVNYLDSISFLAGGGDGTFAPQIEQSLGTYVIAAASGDFNADGKLDLAIVHYDQLGTVKILFGNGNGTFAQVQEYPVGKWPYSVNAADLNGDGRPDLIVVNPESQSLTILLGTPDHRFVAAPDYAFNGLRPFKLAIADINKD